MKKLIIFLILVISFSACAPTKTCVYSKRYKTPVSHSFGGCKPNLSKGPIWWK